jgi:hypothetical protein
VRFTGERRKSDSAILASGPGILMRFWRPAATVALFADAVTITTSGGVRWSVRRPRRLRGAGPGGRWCSGR